MKRITRNIELAEARDLLTRVPRACLAFGGEVEPVAVALENELYLEVVPESAELLDAPAPPVPIDR